jgi:hypothetical protein
LECNGDIDSFLHDFLLASSIFIYISANMLSNVMVMDICTCSQGLVGEGCRLVAWWGVGVVVPHRSWP